MLARVGQGLLDDPDDLDLAVRGEGGLAGDLGDDRGVDAGLPRELLGIAGQALEEGVVGAVVLAQPQDRLPHVAIGVLAVVGDVGQLGLEVVVVLDRRVVCRSLEPQLRGAQHLGQGVVQLARDPVALGDGRPIAVVLHELVDEPEHHEAERDRGQRREDADDGVAVPRPVAVEEDRPQQLDDDDEQRRQAHTHEAQLPQPQVVVAVSAQLWHNTSLGRSV